MSNTEVLKVLFDKYGLIYDKSNPQSKTNDVYVHKHYTIITRQGIQKIERNANIKCQIKVVDSISTPNNVTMDGYGTMVQGPEVKTYQTFASASEETSTNKYYAEMAEKRCRARLVLTLAGLYEQGVYGEDEADKFSDVVKEQQNSVMPKTTYKGN